MEGLSPFETQRRTEWVQRMLRSANSTFGHEDVAWRHRSLMAVAEAGLEGQTVTTSELEDALIPLIGPAPNHASRCAAVNKGCAYGIMAPAGKKKPDGYHQYIRAYLIKGHMELVDGQEVPVMMDGA